MGDLHEIEVDGFMWPGEVYPPANYVSLANLSDYTVTSNSQTYCYTHYDPAQVVFPGVIIESAGDIEKKNILQKNSLSMIDPEGMFFTVPKHGC